MTSAATIREATAADLSTAIDSLRAAGLPVEDLTAGHMDAFLVASDQYGAVGIIGLEAHGDVALLRSLVVDPGRRGAGIGQSLVAALESKARDQGIKECWLLTIDADAFFTRLGYAIRDRDSAPESIRDSSEFSSLCPADAVLMSKRL